MCQQHKTSHKLIPLRSISQFIPAFIQTWALHIQFTAYIIDYKYALVYGDLLLFFLFSFLVLSCMYLSTYLVFTYYHNMTAPAATTPAVSATAPDVTDNVTFTISSTYVINCNQLICPTDPDKHWPTYSIIRHQLQSAHLPHWPR